MGSPYDIPFLALSDSSLNKRYHSCERKFELNKLYGHARNEFDGELPARAGKAMHEAWQEYLITRDRDAAVRKLIMCHPSSLVKSGYGSWSAEACYITLMECLDSPMHSQYELAMVNVNGEQRPAIEVPFRIIFKNVSLFDDRHCPVYYDGFIDSIMYDHVSERFAIFDAKNTRKDRRDYTEMFKRDAQCLPYAFVIDRILGQPPTSLDVHYVVNYVDIMNPKSFKYSFHKTAADIQDWAFGVAYSIRDIKNYARVGYFPKRGGACDVFGVCTYANVCDYREPAAIRQALDLTFGPRDDSKVFEPWFTLELEIEGLA